ncbi:MAG TPA: O-methyltransferase, partial [Thermoanaerobaculia bacterium]
MQELWTAVDDYVSGLYVADDPEIDQADLPEIAVSAPQGKVLYLLALACRANRILEIGTLAGYSAIWMARALPPDGRMVTLEYDPHHADVARANIERAGLADRVEVRVGAALETLPTLEGPFDFIFIDADKENYPAYFRAAVSLSRPGTMIVADNVVRDG